MKVKAGDVLVCQCEDCQAALTVAAACVTASCATESCGCGEECDIEATCCGLPMVVKSGEGSCGCGCG